MCPAVVVKTNYALSAASKCAICPAYAFVNDGRFF